jgi:hypothetical protein
MCSVQRRINQVWLVCNLIIRLSRQLNVTTGLNIDDIATFALRDNARHLIYLIFLKTC